MCGDGRGLVLSGWLEAALAAGESFEAFEMRVKDADAVVP